MCKIMHECVPKHLRREQQEWNKTKNNFFYYKQLLIDEASGAIENIFNFVTLLF